MIPSPKILYRIARSFLTLIVLAFLSSAAEMIVGMLFSLRLVIQNLWMYTVPRRWVST